MRLRTRWIYSLLAAGVLLSGAASAASTPTERRAIAQARSQELSVDNVPPVEVAENVRGEQAEYEFVGRFREREYTGPPGGGGAVAYPHLRLTYGPPGAGVQVALSSEFLGPGPPPKVLPMPSLRGRTRIGADAIGAVKLGDSEQQVISAWGNSCEGPCVYERAAQLGGIPTEGSVRVDFHNGKANDIRIEAVFPLGQIRIAAALAKLKTARHIGLGSTQAQLLHTYPHLRYAGRNAWVYAERAHHDLVFETVDDVVGRIEAERLREGRPPVADARPGSLHSVK